MTPSPLPEHRCFTETEALNGHVKTERSVTEVRSDRMRIRLLTYFKTLLTRGATQSNKSDIEQKPASYLLPKL